MIEQRYWIASRVSPRLPMIVPLLSLSTLITAPVSFWYILYSASMPIALKMLVM